MKAPGYISVGVTVVSNTQRENVELFTIFCKTWIYLRNTKSLLKRRTILTPKYKIIP